MGNFSRQKKGRHKKARHKTAIYFQWYRYMQNYTCFPCTWIIYFVTSIRPIGRRYTFLEDMWSPLHRLHLLTNLPTLGPRRILQHMLQSFSTTFWATRALVSCRQFFWNRPKGFSSQKQNMFFQKWLGWQTKTRWWQLKYLLFSPWKLGKMNPFWWAYFVRWVETTN